jgi:hypothetical protein
MFLVALITSQTLTLFNLINAEVTFELIYRVIKYGNVLYYGIIKHNYKRK